MNIRTPRSGNAARIAKVYLKSEGLEVTHSQALELIARLHGYSDAQSMQADKAFDEALVLKADSSNEFTLVTPKQSSVWITVENISVCIKKDDEGVVADLFAKGAEDEGSLASTYAMYQEAEPMCKKCDSELDEQGYCTDESCPHSDWPQSVETNRLWELSTEEAEKEFGVKKAKRPTMDEVLDGCGLSIGLSNDKHNAGTWEWFERASGEFNAGFETAEDAYRAAADYLQRESGVSLPKIGDNGRLPAMVEPINAGTPESIVPNRNVNVSGTQAGLTSSLTGPFAASEAIKQKYLESGCSRHDVEFALEQLRTQCKGIFKDGNAMWEFLMDERHEDNEAADEELDVAPDAHSGKDTSKATAEPRETYLKTGSLVVSLSCDAYGYNDKMYTLEIVESRDDDADNSPSGLPITASAKEKLTYLQAALESVQAQLKANGSIRRTAGPASAAGLAGLRSVKNLVLVYGDHLENFEDEQSARGFVQIHLPDMPDRAFWEDDACKELSEVVFSVNSTGQVQCSS